MRAFIGYIPAAIVTVTVGVALIRMTVYYKGCMDGIEYVLVALGGFLAGGVLNIAFLIGRYCYGEKYYDFEHDWQETIARWGVRVAWTLVILQAIVVLIWATAGLRRG